MATVAHTIYSHYDPPDKSGSGEATGSNSISLNAKLIADEEEGDADALLALPWRTRPQPPRFVPATLTFDDWGAIQESSYSEHGKQEKGKGKDQGEGVAGWYRSLISSSSGLSTPTAVGRVSATSTPPPLSLPPTPPLRSSNSQDAHTNAQTSTSTSSSLKRKVHTERRSKNNWFIMNAIQSEMSASANSPSAAVSTLQAHQQPPSLADILARNPPPLPSEGRFHPPVWLEIGPGNRGYGMLAKSGWSEGEPLGVGVKRRRKREEWEAELSGGEMIKERKSGTVMVEVIKKQTKSSKGTEVKVEDDEKVDDFDDDDGIVELKKVDIIDLTISDDEDHEGDGKEGSDSDSDDNEDENEDEDEENAGDLSVPLGVSAHGGKALLTPLPTVLKSDRLGIGLKAKTTGPYRASMKRVTHNKAALAAHVRAAGEVRKRKGKYWKGRRGFERRTKEERDRRTGLMAYMNS